MAIPKPKNITTTEHYLPQVPKDQMISQPRGDFDKNRFDTLIAQKGVDVAVEKALQCPCETQKINSLSTCKNCGGTGFIFVNRRLSRFVLQAMDFQNKEEVWSRLVHGIIKVTAPAEEKLSYMDRITRLNANSISTEVIQFEQDSKGMFYGFLSYEPKQVEYLGLFISVDEKLLQLKEDNFSFQGSRIELRDNIDLPYVDKDNPLTATIRYVHAPVFYVTEHNREVIDNYRWDGQEEKLQYLPVLALARRAHDVDAMQQLRQGKLIDNSYDDSNCLGDNIFKPACNPNY